MPILMQREGFWQSPSEQGLPFPIENKKRWMGQKEFIAELQILESSAHSRNFRGMSRCRICGCMNGSGEFSARGWLWPSGFLHYIEEHNVRPSLAFQEFILGRQV